MDQQANHNQQHVDGRLLRLVIVDPVERTRESLRSQFLGLPWIWLQAECTKYDFLQEVLGNQDYPHIVVVSIDADLEKACAAISKLQHELPQVGILAVSIRDDGQAILRALRAGAKEFLTLPAKIEEITDALRRLESLNPTNGAIVGRQGPKIAPTTISVLGSRGGVGCTSTAVNLAATLAADRNFKVVLVDLDLALGDADVALDLNGEYTIGDLAANITRLDMTFLSRSLSKHSSGLYLLPHPINVEEATQINDVHLERILSLLRAGHTHLILDLSKGFRPTDVIALKMSDIILLVVQLELTSLRNALRTLATLDADPILRDKVRVVLNRVGMVTDITREKALEILGKPFFWEIPNDHKAMMESKNNGVPLITSAPHSKVQENFQALANTLCGKNAPKQAAKSFLQSLFSKG